MQTAIRMSLALSVLAMAARAQEPSYDPQGRRDPFLNPMGALVAERASCPGTGLAGQLVQEVALRGVVKTAQGRTALLAGSDGKTHFATEGARLCDGRVARVESDAIVFAQRLRDPLAPARDVEVRLLLHPER